MKKSINQSIAYLVVDVFISFLGLLVCSLVLIFPDLINSLLHLAL